MAKSHENDPWSGFSSLLYLAPLFFLNLTIPTHIVMGISFLILALGSMLYHWKTSYKFQKADEVGMYAAFASVLFAQIFANAPFELAPFFAVFVPVLLTFGSFVWHEKLDSFIIMPIMFAASALISSQHSLSIMLWSLGLGLAGVGIRQLGVYKFPNYDKYLHSVWHLLTAAALTLLTISTL